MCCLKNLELMRVNWKNNVQKCLECVQGHSTRKGKQGLKVLIKKIINFNSVNSSWVGRRQSINFHPSKSTPKTENNFDDELMRVRPTTTATFKNWMIDDSREIQLKHWQNKLLFEKLWIYMQMMGDSLSRTFPTYSSIVLALFSLSSNIILCKLNE